MITVPLTPLPPTPPPPPPALVVALEEDVRTLLTRPYPSSSFELVRDSSGVKASPGVIFWVCLGMFAWLLGWLAVTAREKEGTSWEELRKEEEKVYSTRVIIHVYHLNNNEKDV